MEQISLTNNNRFYPRGISPKEHFDSVQSDKKQNNKINHPEHYTQGGIECINAIRASMTPEAFMGYLKGNVLKYIWRYEKKGGIDDLKKSRVYIRWMIDMETPCG